MAYATRPAQRVVLVGASVCALAFILVMIGADRQAEGRTYWGARIVPPGPAWTGAPIIGVDATDGGTLEGRPDHLEWLRFGGQQSAPGSRDDYPGNNTFYYAESPERMQVLTLQGVQPWWAPLLGQPLRADHFPEPWEGAPAVWRSEGAQGREQLFVVVVKVEPAQMPPEVRNRFAADGFLAYARQDSRNGCLLTYDTDRNPRAFQEGHPLLFDPCHDSRYDVRDVRLYAVSGLHEPGP